MTLIVATASSPCAKTLDDVAAKNWRRGWKPLPRFTLGTFLALSIAMLTGCASHPRDAVPPAMTKRAIRPPATAPAGTQTEVIEGNGKFILYVPAAWHAPRLGTTPLTVHFHGTIWFVIDEHLRRGLNTPLLAFYPGEGSAKYQAAFEDPERFGRVLDLAEKELTKQAGRPVHLGGISVTSFSAGYGAVREILKQDKYIARIDRVLLADSMYAGWDPATTKPGMARKPLENQITPYVKFAQLACDGKKEFVTTVSSIQIQNVPTFRVASELCDRLGVPIRDAAREEITPATQDPDFGLTARADKGGFHAWFYSGTGADAHMTHPRHIAEVWDALAVARGEKSKLQYREPISATAPATTSTTKSLLLTTSSTTRTNADAEASNSSHARAPKPPIVSPSDWGSSPQPIPDSRKQTPAYVTIHHAGTLWPDGRDPVPFLQSMQKWGQREKKWADLPYHFLIAPDGRIFAGRPVIYEPESNTKYALSGNVGIELMGNFEEQRPTVAQLESLAKTVAWLCDEYSIPSDKVRGHKDAAPQQTSCPGRDLDRYLRDGSLAKWIATAKRGDPLNIDPGPPLPNGPTTRIVATTQP